MDNCMEIRELLPEYISMNTTQVQNTAIACHIASCLSCRRDLAFWISVQRSFQQQPMQQLTNAAEIDYKNLFAKLPAKETELDKIINSESYTKVFDLIRYVISTLRTTYRLAGLI